MGETAQKVGESAGQTCRQTFPWCGQVENLTCVVATTAYGNSVECPCVVALLVKTDAVRRTVRPSTRTKGLTVRLTGFFLE